MRSKTKKIALTVGAALSLALVLVERASAQLRLWMPIDIQAVGGGRLQSLVQLIITVLLVIAGVIAVIYLIIGGYQYITSAGNAEQAAAGRTTVLNAIIGLVIIFAAYLIISFIMSQLNLGI